jgi:hypothetical protein
MSIRFAPLAVALVVSACSWAVTPSHLECVNADRCDEAWQAAQPLLRDFSEPQRVLIGQGRSPASIDHYEVRVCLARGDYKLIDVVMGGRNGTAATFREDPPDISFWDS